MKQIIYKLIYSNVINAILRSINKAVQQVLPQIIKIPPSGVIKIKNRNGNILKIKTNQTNYVTQIIYWEGYQNFEYTDIFINLIKKVEVFYDIGANIGFYSLLAAMENETIKVVGFEPASGPLYYFKENVRINKFKNIIIESLALSNKVGEIIFYETKNTKYSYLKHNLSGESNAGSKTDGTKFFTNNVKSITLNKYFEDTSESIIDLIKMDTEGTENLILEKSDVILRQMKPIIICETLFNSIESELEKILRSYEYEFYNHTENGLKKVESIVRNEDDGVRNCFFVHPSKYHLIEEFVI
jgi:FkbM family methyltransferase